MKRFFLVLALVSSISVISQTITRIEVSGKIIVEGSDISGITIFNSSSNTGTITDDNGEFKLKVTLNDIIEVSALQYQNITFKVNDAIIKSKKMKLFLIEEINKLDEVVVFTKGLSGNLNTDLEATKPFKPQLDALYFGVKHSKDYDFEIDNKSEVNNIAIDRQHQPMVNGLNIINVVDQLLLPLFRAEVKDKKKAGVPDVPIESIKYYFGSEFLVDNFKIPEHRVEEFIRFVESGDFDFSLLNYGKEMEFLELLNNKSIDFLN
ncbi:MAG: carboxypeptidase-like regulatory domain-containing protein [Algibacter sp.]|uniref:carboxypeptidase-like regulatory domain-containing protein n=1 Tax=Algibacter sp. TaxID=1872428 RepID=UPI00263320E1|nr:carboxypeptidase-like regulatory domain-containing protein [Algibacter sp.]MDG1730010.1 carboxypeptidase-like regulatory domain-containing protein [Algibacter sp.]MDG2177252.1 carboxypeptidase-like regulatory domain-containing protein [Algibacter sp.]